MPNDGLSAHFICVSAWVTGLAYNEVGKVTCKAVRFIMMCVGEVVCVSELVSVRSCVYEFVCV